MKFLKIAVCALCAMFLFPVAYAGEEKDAQYLKEIRASSKYETVEDIEKAWCRIAQSKVEEGLRYKTQGETLRRAIKSTLTEMELDGRINKEENPQKYEGIHTAISFYFRFAYETEGVPRSVLISARKQACLEKTLLPPTIKEFVAGAKRARARETGNLSAASAGN